MNPNHLTPSATCLEIAPLLPVLDEPGLNPEEVTAARAHLRTCAYCQATVRDYDALAGDLRRRFAPVARPADATEDIMSFINQRDTTNHIVEERPVTQKDTSPPRRVRGIFSGAVAVAAVVLIAVFAQVLFHYGSGGNAGNLPLVTSLSGTKGLLTSVSMVSPTEGWAIGTISKTAAGDVPQGDATLYHYQAGKWSPVLIPVGVSSTRGVFYGAISMDSATDGWAAGSNNDGGAFVLHYANGKWNPMTAPTRSDVISIQALSPTSVWLATQPNGPQSQELYHFDGTMWHVQNLTSELRSGTQITYLAGFQMVSANEGWAVANAANQTGQDGGMAFLHYQNGAWTLAAPLLSNIEPGGLAFSSPNDGWATAAEIVPVNGSTYRVPLKQLLYHYANGQWNAASLPLKQSDNVMLDAISMPTVASGWLAGIDHSSMSGATTTDFSQHAVLLHYANGAWQRVVAPQSGATNDGILNFSFTSATEGWAVGYASNIPSGSVVTDTDVLARAQPLLLHYHDGTWTIYQQ